MGGPLSAIGERRRSSLQSLQSLELPLRRNSSFLSREFHTSPPLDEAAFREIAMLYDPDGGKLKDYENAKVGRFSGSLEWVEAHNQLPAEAHNILDMGAAQGGATVRLAQKYPNANVLASDTDARSAKFINEKISSGAGLSKRTALENPARIQAYTGILRAALAEGKCKNGSMDIVNMDAVAPYLDDDQLRSTLGDIHQAMATGGTLVITGYGEKHGFDEKTGKEDILQKRTDRAMVALLHEAGFEVRAVSNKLHKKGENPLEKTITDMAELGGKGSGAMPSGVEKDENYWHSVKLVAIKRPDGES
jgi:hypothetical protein